MSFLTKMYALSTLSVLLVLTGCTHKIDGTAVLGTFVANHNKGLDEIQLRPDGTYICLCRPKYGQELHSTGHWTFRHENGVPRITFDNFVFCLSDYGAKPAYWDVEVEQSWAGRLRLPLDRDLNYYFIQQN